LSSGFSGDGCHTSADGGQNGKTTVRFEQQVPPTAKSIMLEFEIQPPTASVLVYRTEDDLFPNLLRGTGKETVLLLTPQTLFIDVLADVTSHSIAVLPYNNAGE